MSAPVRLQLSRRAGFDLQALSQATNGLPAVNVARPSRWGNPYKVAAAVEVGGLHLPAITADAAVEAFRDRYEKAWQQGEGMRDELAPLRGKNLACWCRPGAPCHTDVLLEMANRPVCEASDV